MSNGDHRTIDSLAGACRKARAENDELNLTIKSLEKTITELRESLTKWCLAWRDCDDHITFEVAGTELFEDTHRLADETQL